ncbi:MAG: NAD(P)-binding domain-containing protein [Nitrospirae bacterium]|nr:NAD(P)-binding domain-containing protein [Nitrospirota bacterium]
MSLSFITALLYLVPLILIVTLYRRRHRKKESRYRAQLEETAKSGIPEPLTLHPVINPTLCIGSSACVKACPEHALGIVDGKAVLVQPDHCIGHGACESACPIEAIRLVFGTEKRGIDIPLVKPTFETNVPGIFIAGELGGMGLIRKGVEQGRQAVEAIRKSRGGSHEHFDERMEALTKTGEGFQVKTSKQAYRTKNVLLAIGRRGTPRKLGVPGEEHPKVVYRLIDAEQYRHQHVHVVGGGVSAAEAVLAVSAEPGTTVTLSCRGEEIFTRPKDKNRQQLKQRAAENKIRVFLNCTVKEIGPDSVTLDSQGQVTRLRNDAVIVCAGGTLPTPMLKEIGVMVDTYYGTPVPR